MRLTIFRIILYVHTNKMHFSVLCIFNMLKLLQLQIKQLVNILLLSNTSEIHFIDKSYL